MSCDAAGYATLDLKQQLASLGMLEKNCNGCVSRENLFDGVIAAYLLNPLKNDYPYEDIAKDYAGIMIPSRRDLLEKLSYERAAGERPLCLPDGIYGIYHKGKAVRRTLRHGDGGTVCGD